MALSPGAARPPSRCAYCDLPLSTSTTHEKMLSLLVLNGLVRSKSVIDAMKSVDRGDFIPDRKRAYLDRAVLVGHGSQISAPHIHASGLELLAAYARDGSFVLDVGSGTGYVAACLARMGATVRGIEHVPQLVERSIANVSRHHKDLFTSGRLRLCVGDARDYERRRGEPLFDAIHCGAAAEALPEWMWALLKEGGRAVIPLGPEDGPQYLCTVDKKGGKRVVKKLHRVLYVPITDTTWQVKRWDSILVDSYDDEDDDDDLYSGSESDAGAIGSSQKVPCNKQIKQKKA